MHPWGRGVAGDEEEDGSGGVGASAVPPELRGAAAAAAPRFVSGMQDGTLMLWRSVDGFRERTWPGHGWGRAVRCVACLPPSRLITGSTDSSLCVWRLADGAQEQVLSGHTDTVRAVAPLPDGRVLSSADDGTVRLWSLAAGACEAVLEGHTGAVWALALLADSSGRAASGSWDTTVRIWDQLVNGPTCVATLTGHTKEVLALCPLPCSARLVSSSADATLRVWDAAAGTCERALDVGRGGVAHALLSLGSSRVIAGCGDGALRVWQVDPPAARCEQVLKGHADGVWSMALLEDGRVVTGSSDKSICIWAHNKRERVVVPPLAAGTSWALAALCAPPRQATLDEVWPVPEPASPGGSGKAPNTGEKRALTQAAAALSPAADDDDDLTA